MRGDESRFQIAKPKVEARCAKVAVARDTKKVRGQGLRSPGADEGDGARASGKTEAKCRCGRQPDGSK